jgi:hypothetical protein
MDKTIPNETKPKRIALSFETANEIAGALARRQELTSTTILSKDTEAELRGLNQYLTTALANHSEELLGCWFTIRREYEPLLQAFSTVAFRVGAILSRPAPAPTEK